MHAHPGGMRAAHAVRCTFASKVRGAVNPSQLNPRSDTLLGGGGVRLSGLIPGLSQQLSMGVFGKRSKARAAPPAPAVSSVPTGAPRQAVPKKQSGLCGCFGGGSAADLNMGNGQPHATAAAQQEADTAAGVAPRVGSVFDDGEETRCVDITAMQNDGVLWHHRQVTRPFFVHPGLCLTQEQHRRAARQDTRRPAASTWSSDTFQSRSQCCYCVGSLRSSRCRAAARL
jgi:hypothetical protein